jgi:hypothetical protein
LAFIARAKQLGCSLEEITGLTTAWDGGQCGPIQDQLRQLVASKITAAQNKIAELAIFTGELQEAAAALERHRPEGACDQRCGCIGEPDETESPAVLGVRAVSLTSKPAATGEPPIACTLAAGSMKGRIADWQALLAHVDHRERVDGGVRASFAASVPIVDLMQLVAAEQDCCQFFRFAITVDTRGIALEVRAPEDAHEIVESMFGVPT